MFCFHSCLLVSPPPTFSFLSWRTTSSDKATKEATKSIDSFRMNSKYFFQRKIEKQNKTKRLNTRKRLSALKRLLSNLLEKQETTKIFFALPQREERKPLSLPLLGSFLALKTYNNLSRRISFFLFLVK